MQRTCVFRMDSIMDRGGLHGGGPGCALREAAGHHDQSLPSYDRDCRENRKRSVNGGARTAVSRAKNGEVGV